MIAVKGDIVVPYYKDLFKNFFIIILLYIYLFQPPVINKNIYLVLEVIILVPYLLTTNLRPFLSLIVRLKYEILLLGLIILYSILRDLAAGDEVYSFRFAAWTFQAFIFGYAIIDLFETSKKYSGKKYNLFILLYWTSFIGAVLTFLLITNKSLSDHYNAIQLDDFEAYDALETRYRAFGMSENLTFTYSYVLGFFAGYTLLVIRKNALLIIPFLLFVLGVFFNARIGFTGIIFFTVILLLRRQWANLFITGGLSVGIVTCIILSSADLVDMITSNSDWAFQFFYDISDSLFGTHLNTNPGGSTIQTLTRDFIIFPDSVLHWIFGSGESLFVKIGGNSDIGYIIQLNYGGILFLALIMAFVFYLCYRLYKILGWRHWYFIVFTLSVFVLNFKGFIFAATPGGRFLFFLYVYFIYQSYKKNDADTNISADDKYLNNAD
jgi:hypothetical protein